MLVYLAKRSIPTMLFSAFFQGSASTKAMLERNFLNARQRRTGRRESEKSLKTILGFNVKGGAAYSLF